MKKKWVFLLCFLLGASFPAFPRPATAQEALLEFLQDNKKEEKKIPLEEEIHQKKEESQAELNQVQKDLDSLSSAPASKLSQNLQERKALLAELILYYDQIVEALNRGKELTSQIQSTRNNLNLWSQESPPENLIPSFDLFEKLSDQLDQERERTEASENAEKSLQASLDEAKDDFDDLEKERRRVKEQLETTEDPSLKQNLQYRLSILQVESRVAQAKSVLFHQELGNESLVKSNSGLLQELLVKKIAWVKDKVHFTEADLKEKLNQVETERKKISQALSLARHDLQAFEKRLKEVLSPKPGATPPPEKVSPQKLEIYQAQRQGLQNRISVLAQHIQRMDDVEETWRHRFLAFNQLAAKTQLAEWQSSLEDSVEQVHRQETLVNVRLTDLRKNLADLDQRISSLRPQESSLKGPLQEQRNILQNLLEENQDYLLSLSKESQLYHKFLAELSPQVTKLGVREKIVIAWNQIIKIWNFEITSIDDKPITVKKLVFVLILLLLGFRLSRRLSRWFGKRILPKFGLAVGVAAGLQTLVFYLLVTFVTLIVLYTVHVPLTMFTVLGGALAIGVGFGSQNIVRNFISGLILLMEQPIKIGDMVQVDDIHGTIEKIGARSTRIRSFNNIHVIVPNSDLLEKKVINWTLSDDLVRVNVNVGVAYGSPTREVAKLIRKAVDEHGKVLPSPEPIVLFKDFGDNALQFEIHFWIKMRTLMDRERITSDIHFRIDSLFREAGITIAFPQRDVHLNSLSPIEVKLIPEAPEPKVASRPSQDLP